MLERAAAVAYSGRSEHTIERITVPTDSCGWTNAELTLARFAIALGGLEAGGPLAVQAWVQPGWSSGALILEEIRRYEREFQRQS